MNQKTIGATITSLRKKKGLTQSALAHILNVSDKAVSKWETGLGYPEITLLPKLAKTFGNTCAAAMQQGLDKNLGYLDIRTARVEAIKNAVKAKMELFGSVGKK